MRAAILLIEGTNCEDDALTAFERVGAQAEKVHLKQLTGDCIKERQRELSDFDMLFLPGGWSAGDYVRAGAIFAARMKSKLGPKLTEFIESGKMVVGVCNGFQVLVEAGILPGFDGISDEPEAVLAQNASNRFQCRPAYIRHDARCMITNAIELGTVMEVPIAHAEGRLSFGDNVKQALELMEKNNQVVFRYCHPDGEDANGVFPWNPNGSTDDIAGICNPKGNVLGMMPHPERVMEGYLQAEWTRSKEQVPDGLRFFESLVKGIKE